MEAILLNSSAVFLKWKQPTLKAQHGVLLYYHIVVRGIDTAHNFSRILTNVTIDAASPTLVLANLTEGVMYTVSVAAGNNAGIGPYCSPATLRLDPITKRLDPFINQRYPINQDHVDDVLTQPWFIILLGAILAIMMLSFGAMVFVKRKHMMMKQSALNTIRGTHPNDVLKMPSLSRNGNGYWLDASTGGMVWRTQPSGDTLDMQKDQIDDYAPVCLTNNTANGAQNTTERGTGQQRYVGEYSNIPTDYAEVTSFGKNGSEYGVGRKNASSPAPYATSSIVQQQQQQQQQQSQPRYQTRPGINMQQQQMVGTQQQQQQRPMHPHFHQQQQQLQPQQQQSSNNIYQQMSTTSEIYPSQMNSNRSAYSDQYYYPKEKIHITENKLSNCHTYDTANQHQPSPLGFANIGTLRRSGNNQHSNRFKIINTQPQNYQLHLADNPHQKQQLKMNTLNNNQNNGDYSTQDMITKNLMDLDAGSFCYNGMADSGCGGSPSPMAMLMSHDDEHGEEEQALYHTADGDNESDMERLYVKVDENPQQQQQLISLTPSSRHGNTPQSQSQSQQQQQQQPPHHLHQTQNQENPNNQMAYNNWRSHNSSTRSTASSSYAHRNPNLAMASNKTPSNTNAMTNNASSSSVSANGLLETTQTASPQMHHLHPLHQQQPSSDSEMIYAPGSSMASERSLLSNSGSSTCGGNGSGLGMGQPHNV
uniref:Fibronectin type-III domain-containing protein n=1 Tax=Stomoxys calcitrans TaxID=35570 RepID=A0A1I8P6Z1_STOCA